MFRKYLAVLLLLSWIVPSGLDAVEELYSPEHAEIQNNEAFPASSSYLSFTNKLLESADAAFRHRSVHPENPASEFSLRILAASPKIAKLYKLYGVFLI